MTDIAIDQQPPQEARSRVKLTRNAKGDPQWEVSVVAGEDPEELRRATAMALDEWRYLEQELCR